MLSDSPRISIANSETRQILVSDFEADYFGTEDEPGRFLIVSVTPRLLDDSARLVARHGLRAYDAVQLASAHATHVVADEGVVFAAFDKHSAPRLPAKA